MTGRGRIFNPALRPKCDEVAPPRPARYEVSRTPGDDERTMMSKPL
jgi:hypothetical protein